MYSGRMKTYLWTAALVAAWGGAPAKRLCAQTRSSLDCKDRGLTHPPPGHWPHVHHLSLHHNALSRLYEKSFTGFPHLRGLSMPFNNITVLELQPFADIPLLQSLLLYGNPIHTITSTHPRVVLNNLLDISMDSNNRLSLKYDALLCAPNLDYLHFGTHQIEMPRGRPFLKHPKLTSLTVRTANGLCNATFQGLPHLKALDVSHSRLSDVAGAFAAVPLESLNLARTQVAAVAPGAFSPSGVLRELNLDGTALRRLPLAAVHGAVARGGAVSIDGTPLACACGFERLRLWSEGRGVRLSARCSGVACPFRC